MLFFPPGRLENHRANSTHFSGTLIWNQLSNSVKSSKSIAKCKNKKLKLKKKKLGNIDCGFDM